MEKVQYLKIPLEEIKLATSNFSDENFIARGGFGKVYIGKLTKSGKQNIVAVKRLDRTHGQGNREFLMEIQMLSCYKHKNLISLLGFCEEDGEKILVYEHAKHGSLDRYLTDDKLSWMQRLKISLGAARGFNYLHNDVGPQHRVLHRDIKSSNILLDDNWEAKISDFGLSKIGPSNVEFTFLVTNACGTYGYIDPQYRRTGILTKESDVYSFGVVLFEILCGRLAFVTKYQDERRFLDSLAQRSYEQNRLHDIILSGIKNEIKTDSLKVFSMVAYECLKENRIERPTMAWIVEKLEEALEYQEPLTRNLTTEFVSRLPIQGEQENVDALIKCVKKDNGFSQGIPITAFTIYKCLVHWKSFEVERTSIFDHLNQLIASATEGQDNNKHLAYWLSNASTLLLLLQRIIKPDGVNSVCERPPPPASLFARKGTGFRTSQASDIAAVEVVRQVKAKHPALLFMQQLTSHVEKMYAIIRDNLKTELTFFLGLCIQASLASKGVPQANPWHGIIDCLNAILNTLKENFVTPFIVRKIFTQVFSFINVQLFNSLLLRRVCCTINNGEYVQAGLAELKQWCFQEIEEYLGSAWYELNHIKQAVRFLVHDQKHKISYDELIYDLCPALSIKQVYRICTLFGDDKHSTRSVSSDVISSMRLLMTEDSNYATSSAFLLEDDSSIPFSVDEISSSLQVKEFKDVKPAVELAKNPTFHFLYE